MSKGRLHRKFATYIPTKGKPFRVYINDHTYLDEIYSRLSNWVSWIYVTDLECTTLDPRHGEVGGAYDYEDNFIDIRIPIVCPIIITDPLTNRLLNVKEY